MRRMLSKVQAPFYPTKSRTQKSVIWGHLLKRRARQYATALSQNKHFNKFEVI